MRRVLVTGSRNFPYKETVFEALDLQYTKHGRFVLVHGACPSGADAYAAEWIKLNPNHAVEEAHAADWNLHGRSAGFKRNAEMIACQPDVVLAFRNKMSGGTSHTLGLAKDARIPSITWDLYA